MHPGRDDEGVDLLISFGWVHVGMDEVDTHEVENGSFNVSSIGEHYVS